MPDDANLRINKIFARAAQLHRSGQIEQARSLYRIVIEMDPLNADCLHLAGVAELQSGRYAEAVDLIARAIARNDKIAAFHNNLGNALRARGQLPQALQAFGNALALNPDAPDARFNLAVVLQELGRLQEAAAHYRQVIAVSAGHAAAHSNLGNVLRTQGHLDEALASYQQALRAQPKFLPALINQGNVQKMKGLLQQAADSYRRALAIDTRSAEAHNNLGLALFEDDRTDEAIACYERALSLFPRYSQAHRNLGHALRERGKPVEAIESYRRAIALVPDEAEARLGLATAAIPVFVESVAESEVAVSSFTGALQELSTWNLDFPGRLGHAVGLAQPFYLAYRPFEILKPLSRYGDLVCDAANVAFPPNELAGPAGQRADERVRLAVVCGHVHRRHPVWEVLLRGILAHLPRNRVEIFLYHTGAHIDDETQWAKAQVDRFVQGPKSTADWVQETRKDRPDIIFYPEVGMDPGTGALAALRLAPVQAASWGHPVTTGLSTMDLFISGQLIEGAHAGPHYREELVCLPGTGACTRAPDMAPSTWDGAAARERVVRFALPHQPIKFDPADDALLATIAKQLSACEFWISTPARLGWATERLCARLGRVFREQGLNPENHLRVTPWLGPHQFLGFLDSMDVYLDCPAFSGYTTAWHAVHRGLPIVTLEGQFMRQRLAAGLLRQIGALDGIAQTRAQFVQLAVKLGEECRVSQPRAARRATIKRLAPAADENIAAVHAFERALSEAVEIPHKVLGKVEK